MKAIASLVLLAIFSATASATVNIEMVPVGNPGNEPDSRSSYGAVDHIFRMAKYEVTAGEYTEFLNAVADDDPNWLYNELMANPGVGGLGANIQRVGEAPNYSYSVAADWANRPVNYVSFWDAVRYANWLHNGQPTGAQGVGTTETGAYINLDTDTFTRLPDARYWIPTEDQWYKAAYYNPSDSSYVNYPTGTMTAPGRDLTEATNPGSNANYHSVSYTIGSPYYRTEVGEFELSDSIYGTFDQGGNVMEWTETEYYHNTYVVRGGSFTNDKSVLHAGVQFNREVEEELLNLGFRVAGIAVSGLLGDYNGNDVIDAADYTVWRDAMTASSTSLLNDPTPGTVDENDFTYWRNNFGEVLGSGSGSVASVPEPTSLWLLLMGAFVLVGWRRASGFQTS